MQSYPQVVNRPVSNPRLDTQNALTALGITMWIKMRPGLLLRLNWFTTGWIGLAGAGGPWDLI